MLGALRDLFRRKPAPDADQPIGAPDALQACRSRGNDFIAKGDLISAEAAFREAVKLQANDPKSLLGLGYALKELGRAGEAEATLQHCIQFATENADTADAWYMLANLAEARGDLECAEQNFRKALSNRPEFSLACKDLCRVLHLRGFGTQVQQVLESCTVSAPACADYRLWLADIYESEFDFAGVVQQLRAAYALGVRKVSVLTTLGAAEFRTGYPAEALETFRVAASLDPAVGYEAHFHHGYFLVRNGDLQRGVVELTQTVLLRPDYFAAHSLLLMALSYMESANQNSYRHAAQRFAQAAAEKVDKAFAIAKRQLPNQPVRLGFVSGDFRTHPVVHFLRGMLAHLDRSQFSAIAYSSNSLEDEGTKQIRPLFDVWNDIRAMDDGDAAGLIRGHGIDVLIDLGGHTGGGRTTLFAWRPAAIQVTWLGYFASTGLDEVDYILADDVSVPPDSAEWFSEQVYRLPDTRLCMARPEPAAEVFIDIPPCVRRGFVTYGVFQQVGKITASNIAAWGSLLQSMPTARLRIQGEGLQLAETRQQLSLRLTAAGVDAARVDLLAPVPFESYLQAHNDVDVLLDTFPYPGGTTTAWALWMGVPTITMAGNTMLSRQGLMMMHCVGLDALVAHDEAVYQRLAIETAKDVDFLSSLRRELRGKALASPLFDEQKFAKEFQKAMWHMVEQKLGNAGV